MEREIEEVEMLVGNNNVLVKLVFVRAPNISVVPLLILSHKTHRGRQLEIIDRP